VHYQSCAQQLESCVQQLEGAFTISPDPEEWRPIETAPKDREVLVFDEGAIIVSLWVEDEQAWWDNGPMRPPPTHWRPLPAPPAPTEEPEYPMPEQTPVSMTSPRDELSQQVARLRTAIEIVERNLNYRDGQRPLGWEMLTSAVKELEAIIGA
jgi:hypothetical protein